MDGTPPVPTEAALEPAAAASGAAGLDDAAGPAAAATGAGPDDAAPDGAALPNAVDAGGGTGGANGAAGPPPPNPALSPREKSDDAAGGAGIAGAAPAPPGKPALPRPPGEPKPCVGKPPPPNPLGVEDILGSPPPARPLDCPSDEMGEVLPPPATPVPGEPSKEPLAPSTPASSRWWLALPSPRPWSPAPVTSPLLAPAFSLPDTPSSDPLLAVEPESLLAVGSSWCWPAAGGESWGRSLGAWPGRQPVGIALLRGPPGPPPPKPS